MLKSISLSSTTLIIESRDCIGNPENYRIVATFTDTSIELVDIPFSATVRSDVADLTPNTPYYITVTIVETSSNITIDEKNTSITNTSSTCETPNPTDNNDCTSNERVRIYVAVGICGGMVIGVVVGAVITILGMCLKRSKDTPKSTTGKLLIM